VLQKCKSWAHPFVRWARASGAETPAPFPFRFPCSPLFSSLSSSRPSQSHASFYHFPPPRHNNASTPPPSSPSASFPFRPANPNPNPVVADAEGPTRPPPTPRLRRPLRPPRPPSPAPLLARRAGALGFSSWTRAAPPRAAGAPTAAAAVAGSPTPRCSTSR
jgi:hypothetical protein